MVPSTDERRDLSKLSRSKVTCGNDLVDSERNMRNMRAYRQNSARSRKVQHDRSAMRYTV